MGGTSPREMKDRFSAPATRRTAVSSGICPEINSDNPFSDRVPTAWCSVPRRMSASISSTRWPAWAMVTARLAQTKVLPTPGLGAAIISTLFLVLKRAKCRLVRRLRSASIARSVGAFRASRRWRPTRLRAGMQGDRAPLLAERDRGVDRQAEQLDVRRILHAAPEQLPEQHETDHQQRAQQGAAGDDRQTLRTRRAGHVDLRRIDHARIADRAGARDVELLRLVEQVGIGAIGHFDVARQPEQALLGIGQLRDAPLQGRLFALEAADLLRAAPGRWDARA